MDYQLSSQPCYWDNMLALSSLAERCVNPLCNANESGSVAGPGNP